MSTQVYRVHRLTVAREDQVIEEDKDREFDDTTAATEDEPVLSDEDHDGDEVILDPMEQIAALEAQVAGERDRLLRTAAELDNVRKRARRDVADAEVRGRFEVLTELLPALDSLDLALGTSDPAGSAQRVLEGVEMVRRQFLAAMERFGMRPIEAGGARFDPAFHEAVAQRPSADHEDGMVIEELRKGYVLGERLLRASMVVVSSGAPAAAADGDAPDAADEPPVTADAAAEAAEGGAVDEESKDE